MDAPDTKGVLHRPIERRQHRMELEAAERRCTAGRAYALERLALHRPHGIGRSRCMAFDPACAIATTVGSSGDVFASQTAAWKHWMAGLIWASPCQQTLKQC